MKLSAAYGSGSGDSMLGAERKLGQALGLVLGDYEHAASLIAGGVVFREPIARRILIAPHLSPHPLPLPLPLPHRKPSS